MLADIESGGREHSMAHGSGPPDRATRQVATLLVATALTVTGCQGMATTRDSIPPQSASAQPGPLTEFSLRFLRHNFGIATYAVQAYSVVYANRPYTGGARPAREEVHPNAFKNTSAGHLMIRNFPPPAVVKWTSRDGTPLEAEVDIGRIFKDELVRYEAPRDEISDRTPAINPDIVLEINDRTINVHMRAYLSLKAPRIPGNRHSNFQHDLLLVWSETY